MAVGYYYDVGSKRYKHTSEGGEAPKNAVYPTIEKAMFERGDAPVPTDYASPADNGAAVEESSGIDMNKAGNAAAKSLLKGGGVGDAITTGAIASGNPWVIGGALGLKVLGDIASTPYKQAVAKYNKRSQDLDNLQKLAMSVKV